MTSKHFRIAADQIKEVIRPMGSFIATDQITVDGLGIGYMYREEPDNSTDSGWRFFSGREDQAYVDEPSHMEIYDVNTIANYDPTIIPHLSAPVGSAFGRVAGTDLFQRE